MQNIRNVMTTLLLSVFVSYYSGISFFRHAHVVNGVTVVHSHPHKKASENVPEHRHDETQMQLISLLSQFSAVGGATALQIVAPCSICNTPTTYEEPEFVPRIHFDTFRLRAPPLEA